MDDAVLVGRVVFGVLQGFVSLSWGLCLGAVVEPGEILISIDAFIDLLHSLLIALVQILYLPLLDIIKGSMELPLSLLSDRVLPSRLLATPHQRFCEAFALFHLESDQVFVFGCAEVGRACIRADLLFELKVFS